MSNLSDRPALLIDEPAPSLALGPARSLAQSAYTLAEHPAEPSGARIFPISFTLNGRPIRMEIEARTTLLVLLQEKLQLGGTKQDCDYGQCGACTVLIDGRRVLSCLTLAATVDQKEVTTIEGLASAGKIHPLQAAFIAHGAYQCERCTAGQLMSAAGFLKEAWPRSPEGIREGMAGNTCQCGSYGKIAAAIAEVRDEAAETAA